MKKNYISNSSESTRMFENNFLEGLSKIHYSVPLFIYVPVILIFSYLALFTERIGAAFILYYFIGIAVWTGTEYLLHRYVFHFYPSSKWGQRIHFIFHGVHHDFPKDARRLVMPPAVSIPLAILFYFLFSLIFESGKLYAFFPGFITGYLVYDMMHYAMHHYNFKSPFWLKIKQHHMLHHYSDPSKGYGVSSKLWDLIFHSDFIKKKV